MNKATIGLAVVLLLGFCLIIWAADSAGAAFGKAGENIALGIIAVVLAAGLIIARKDRDKNE